MKGRNLRDEGITCLTMLVLGISNAAFISREVRKILLPPMLVALAVSLLLYMLRLPSAQDMEREVQDERNRMIQEKATWYSRQMEDIILMVLYVVLAIGFQQYTIGYTLFWFMIGRWWLSFGIRWWLNRKY